ncbi:MAG: HEAT repeat domain-containing protein [Syntrophobacterales bacterium]|jgi:HEAT repeat protein
MRNEKLPTIMAPLLRIIVPSLFGLSLLACATTITKPNNVWYQQDTLDSTMRTDLAVCESDTTDQTMIADCMRTKGYLLISKPQAELLLVRSLQEEGLNDDEIATQLQWNEKKVRRYLDEDYELPRTASFGRQPIEISVRIGKPAVRPLIADLKDNDPLVRSNAVKALGAIEDPRAVKPLIAVLDDIDPLIQRQAVKALGRINDLRAVEPLIGVLEDREKKPYVRMSAAEALGSMGDSRAVEPLVDALYDPHWEVRGYAAEALGRIGDPRAVEPLIAALKDQDATVRGNAADGLAKIRDPRAIEALSAALTDKSKTVRKKAARALAVIAGEDFW